MKLGQDQKNPSLSEDLTVILLRGNGSPRTFRLSLPALQRSLTALGFLFALSIVAALSLLLLNVFRSASSLHLPERPAPVAVTEPAPQQTPTPEAKTPFWKSLTGANSNGGSSGDESELRKEMQGLRDDIAKLAAQADGRKELPSGQLTGLLQFFGPRNLEEGISPISVKNVRVSQSPAGSTKEIYVDFELHNIDPEQRLARGYIIVLAKSPGYLTVYPENAFSPTQNIVLDYTKGETFGVSRFREARARFPAAPMEGTKPRFQVLLFNSEGKVIANMHVEGQR